MTRVRRNISSSLRLIALLFVMVLIGGCSTLLSVTEQQRLADTNCIVSGTITTEKPARGPLVVGLFERVKDDYVLVDYFTATKPGEWLMAVPAGTYWLAAFEDANGD